LIVDTLGLSPSIKPLVTTSLDVSKLPFNLAFQKPIFVGQSVETLYVGTTLNSTFLLPRSFVIPYKLFESTAVILMFLFSQE
jgi:hypothetical protein